MFVLRDQMDRNKNVFFEQLSKFKDNLQHSSSILCLSIDDELEIHHNNIALLPSAFSEDINPDLNLSQRWRNQTFPSEINQLRNNIFVQLFEQMNKNKSGYKNFDYFYKKMSSNWKSIDELGQSLLECKNLYELSIINELKAIVKDIILTKSQQLLQDGRKLLKQLLDDRKNQTPTKLDTHMKEIFERGNQQLEDLSSALVHEGNNEFELRTQQESFVIFRDDIQKNVEPSIRCNQQLLQQEFEEDIYKVVRESTENHVQQQLLGSAKEFFERQTHSNVDIEELKRTLDEKYVELKNEFQQRLESMHKNDEDIKRFLVFIIV
jgi:hypothetical protein